jgi:hypothetical protein
VQKIFRLTLSLLIAAAAAWPNLARAQQQQACYVGQDYQGGQAILRLVSERYGDSYEIYGVFQSAAVGTMQLKADGWSGAGRMFQSHEYESGAIYIQISDYTGSSFVLAVEDYGRFPFQQTNC